MKQATHKQGVKPTGWGRLGGSSNILFSIAVRTLQSIAADSQQSEPGAMVCAVFAVAAVETFVYELGVGASDWLEDSEYTKLFRGLGALVRDMEESRFQLPTKLTWIARYLTGKVTDRGSGTFQEFETLVRLRNAIIHMKYSEETLMYEDGSIDFDGTPKVAFELESKGLIPRPYRPSWMGAICNRRIAVWSTETANNMISALLNMLPASQFKKIMKFSHPAFNRDV